MVLPNVWILVECKMKLRCIKCGQMHKGTGIFCPLCGKDEDFIRIYNKAIEMKILVNPEMYYLMLFIPRKDKAGMEIREKLLLINGKETNVAPPLEIKITTEKTEVNMKV